MKRLADECGAKNPATLRGTALRRQIATLAQMISMSDNEIHTLANFMGHSFEVHMGTYRQPEITLQTTKLAAFLMRVGDSNVNRYKGKTLEELANECVDFPVDQDTGFILEKGVDPDHPNVRLDSDDEPPEFDHSPASPSRRDVSSVTFLVPGIDPQTARLQSVRASQSRQQHPQGARASQSRQQRPQGACFLLRGQGLFPSRRRRDLPVTKVRNNRNARTLSRRRS